MTHAGHGHRSTNRARAVCRMVARFDQEAERLGLVKRQTGGTIEYANPRHPWGTKVWLFVIQDEHLGCSVYQGHPKEPFKVSQRRALHWLDIIAI